MKDYILKPLEVSELKKSMDDNGYVRRNVLVDLDCIINNDFEGFLDELSCKLTGTELLMDINYKVVGVFDDVTLIMEVSGDVSSVIDVEDDDDEEDDSQAESADD